MMKQVLVIGIVAMFAATAFASGAAVQTQPNFLAKLRADMLKVSGGDLSKTGTLTMNGVTTTISGNEILAFLSERSIANAPTLVTGVGANVGYGSAAITGTGWPFCDFATLFNEYFGTPGSKIGTVTPLPQDPNAGTHCGSPGITQSATMDLSSDIIGCGAAVIMSPPQSIPVGSVGGYACPNSGSGQSIGSSGIYALGFFGLALDVIEGSNAALVVNAAA